MIFLWRNPFKGLNEPNKNQKNKSIAMLTLHRLSSLRRIEHGVIYASQMPNALINICCIYLLCAQSVSSKTGKEVERNSPTVYCHIPKYLDWKSATGYIFVLT